MAIEGGRQLVLDLPVEARHGEDDFLVGASNAAAHGFVGRWPDWPAGAVVLCGPEGSGKTHLAAIWARRAGAPTLPAAAIGADPVPDQLRGGALAVENLHRGPLRESALFHLLNLARERGGSLLLTSRTSPDGLGLATPDLLSRLRLAPLLRLEAPDDALLRAVMVKLFHDRQLAVDATVVAYLARRMERSFAGAGALVAALDREALRLGRKVTRPMAAEILKELGLDDGTDV